MRPRSGDAIVLQRGAYPRTRRVRGAAETLRHAESPVRERAAPGATRESDAVRDRRDIG